LTPPASSRTPHDLAILLEASAGWSAADPASRIPGMTTRAMAGHAGGPPCGFSPDLLGTAIAVPHLAAYQRAMDVLSGLGATIGVS
jgi:hypothetical protein